ncbi:MAG: glycosyl hydrolase family 18 protein [Armatimonadota bacterium]|nr:glycosyl hydrolase family 18 protein [Armatimonadota bacterium]
MEVGHYRTGQLGCVKLTGAGDCLIGVYISEKLKQAWKFIKRPPWRTIVPAVSLLLLLFLAHAVWSPGYDVTDGRHDLSRNGIWLQHGWLGHNSWFIQYGKTDKLPRFRNVQRVRELAALLRHHHITDVFPHLCPTQPDGAIMPVDDRQTEMFLRELQGFRVLPWIGGVLDSDVAPDNAQRRKVFVNSIKDLLHKHPKFAGVHLNVEPWPSGHKEMLVLLEEIRQALPAGKILSVAAYPPPTFWHRFPEVHWEQAYFKQVAQRVDQMAVMMYDTSLKDGKLYQNLMRSWTQQVLDWSQVASGQKSPVILLGVPTYDDAGVGYHNPDVENLANALPGIHASLGRSAQLPAHYQGVAIYCEWETTEPEWQHLREHFLKLSGQH